VTVKENNQKRVGAHILISCGIDEKEALLDRINNLENVVEISEVSGNYDIITKINADNTKSLLTTIKDELGKVVNISSAIMLIHTDLQHLNKNKDKSNTISNKGKIIIIILQTMTIHVVNNVVYCYRIVIVLVHTGEKETVVSVLFLMQQQVNNKIK